MKAVGMVLVLAGFAVAVWILDAYVSRAVAAAVLALLLIVWGGSILGREERR